MAQHSLGWVHRDIKPENILLTDITNLVVKIADFGLAKKIDDKIGHEALAMTLCGTPSCMLLLNSPCFSFNTILAQL